MIFAYPTFHRAVEAALQELALKNPARQTGLPNPARQELGWRRARRPASS